MRIAWIAALSALVALAGAPAASAQEPPAEKSANVSWLDSLPEPQVVSAHFRTRGTREEMYVSTLRGLATYDITDPAKPEKLGFLPLPHFENEDVDLAASRDLLLISNDPSEGAGVLYVISIADPAAPAILGQMSTGNAGSGSGFGFLFDAIPGVVPLPESVKTGTGHTASCVDAGAVECRYVYLAGTAAGIDIVDLADPAAPRYATPRNFPAEAATAALASHDVQFDRHGLAWVAGYGGTAAYDVSDPLAPRLVYRTDEQGRSGYAENPANDGKSLNDFIHHNSLRIPNRSLAKPPAGADPDADSDVVLITEEDYNRPGCAGAGSFESWRISSDVDSGGTPLLHPLGRFDVEEDAAGAPALCSAHYFDERAGLVAQGWYEQGTRLLSVADPARIEQVGYWIPAGNVTWGALFPPNDPSGELVYALDHSRGIDVLRVDRPEPAAGGDGGTPASPGGPSGAPATPGTPARPGPDVALSIRDGRSRVLPGRRVRYRLRVRNRSRVAARDVTVRAVWSRAAKRIGGRRSKTFRIRSLAAGARRDLRLVLRARRTRAARLVLVARATAPGDANRANDRAVDRNRLRAPQAEASAVLRMAVVRSPRLLTVGPRTAGAVVYGLCRLAPALGP